MNPGPETGLNTRKFGFKARTKYGVYNVHKTRTFILWLLFMPNITSYFGFVEVISSFVLKDSDFKRRVEIAGCHSHTFDFMQEN